VPESAIWASVIVGQVDGGNDHEALEFYRCILLPYFRADELEAEDNYLRLLRAGKSRALAARLPDGTLVGGVLSDWFPDSEVLLLSYLAVPTEYREHGIGAKLLAAIGTEWSADPCPRLMIAEVEDPRHYRYDAALGDPARRVSLYERVGARALPVPYVQPALQPGRARVANLMLMVFGGADAPPGTSRVDGRTVEQFLVEFYELSEGQVRADDEQLQAMLAACRQPGGLPMLLASELPLPEAPGQTSGGGTG
jgi:GNAT superfamily N-acetyltransferase